VLQEESQSDTFEDHGGENMPVKMPMPADPTGVAGHSSLHSLAKAAEAVADQELPDDDLGTYLCKCSRHMLLLVG